MRIVVSGSLLIVAVIHLLPSYGLLGGRALTALYGTPPLAGDLSILMRHRAAMFGTIGLFLCAAALQPALQPAALLVGAASVVSFLLLALGSAPYNDHIAKVVLVDVVALVALSIGAAALVFERVS
jgi:hypothetical protein